MSNNKVVKSTLWWNIMQSLKMVSSKIKYKKQGTKQIM